MTVHGHKVVTVYACEVVTVHVLVQSNTSTETHVAVLRIADAMQSAWEVLLPVSEYDSIHRLLMQKHPPTKGVFDKFPREGFSGGRGVLHR